MNATVMVINDRRYIEAKENPKRKTACEQCAFAFDSVGCFLAVTEAAPQAFGGDCAQRGVIYLPEEAADA